MTNNPVYKAKKAACEKLGWEVVGDNVWAFGESHPLGNPYAIALKVYRKHESQETRYQALKTAYNILWPQHAITYNYWMERIFREHVDHDTEIFTIASGGGAGKTAVMAWIGLMFFLAYPQGRTVIVTSTTIESLKSRIFGYMVRGIKEMAVPVPWFVKRNPAPTIKLDPQDDINGIYGIAAVEGDDEKTIRNIIGRHPKNALMLILDEAPDMPLGIVGAIPNLKKSLEDRFQCVAIGNAKSTDDLHGAMSTPKVGWEKIDPYTDYRWPTTQPNGYCLYLNPYDSPAIHETDPVKKAALSKFLITEEALLASEQNYGKDSIDFWRFTMGFWKSRSIEQTVVSEEFIKQYDPMQPAEFSGLMPLRICAGLDIGFSTGGDKCILRLAVMGHHVSGKVVLDFRGSSFLFVIKIQAHSKLSAEQQIAHQTIEVCDHYGVALNTLCVDASGQGRGMADIIQLVSKRMLLPIKIYATKPKRYETISNPDTDLVVIPAYEQWFLGRQFISNQQIYGLDQEAAVQLYTRRIEEKGGRKELESKKEYKRRMAIKDPARAHSPDEADAGMLTIQSAVLNYGLYVGQTHDVQKFDSEEQRKYNAALVAYKKMHDGAADGRPFVLRAGYSSGIASVVKKRAF